MISVKDKAFLPYIPFIESVFSDRFFTWLMEKGIADKLWTWEEIEKKDIIVMENENEFNDTMHIVLTYSNENFSKTIGENFTVEKINKDKKSKDNIFKKYCEDVAKDFDMEIDFEAFGQFGWVEHLVLKISNPWKIKLGKLVKSYDKYNNNSWEIKEIVNEALENGYKPSGKLIDVMLENKIPQHVVIHAAKVFKIPLVKEDLSKMLSYMESNRNSDDFKRKMERKKEEKEEEKRKRRGEGKKVVKKEKIRPDPTQELLIKCFMKENFSDAISLHSHLISYFFGARIFTKDNLMFCLSKFKITDEEKKMYMNASKEAGKPKFIFDSLEGDQYFDFILHRSGVKINSEFIEEMLDSKYTFSMQGLVWCLNKIKTSGYKIDKNLANKIVRETGYTFPAVLKAIFDCCPMTDREKEIFLIEHDSVIYLSDLNVSTSPEMMKYLIYNLPFLAVFKFDVSEKYMFTQEDLMELCKNYPLAIERFMEYVKRVRQRQEWNKSEQFQEKLQITKECLDVALENNILTMSTFMYMVKESGGQISENQLWNAIYSKKISESETYYTISDAERKEKGIIVV